MEIYTDAEDNDKWLSQWAFKRVLIMPYTVSAPLPVYCGLLCSSV